MASHLFIDGAVDRRRPGILVFPEAFGLGDHALEKAHLLAGMGYAALACDLHGDGRLLPDLAAVGAEIGPLSQDADRMRSRARTAFDVLAAQPGVAAGQIGAIGFCFGGTLALELARSGAPLAATVGFHSGLGTPSPSGPSRITGKVLVCIGADDPIVPHEQRATFEEEMKAGGVDWAMHLYGGVAHSFTDPSADARGSPDILRYDQAADRESWHAMTALFDKVFHAPNPIEPHHPS